MLRSDRMNSSSFSKHCRLKLFPKGKGKVFLSVFFSLAFVASNWINRKKQAAGVGLVTDCCCWFTLACCLNN